MLQRITCRASLCVGLCCLLGGCSLLGNDRLEQCQSESEQLLSDYRRQRDRAERLEMENRQLTHQIAEVEKQLALTSRDSDQRVASRSPGSAAEPSGGDRTDSAPRQGRSAGARTPNQPLPAQSPPAAPPSSQAASDPTDQDQPMPKPAEDNWRSVPRS